MRWVLFLLLLLISGGVSYAVIGDSGGFSGGASGGGGGGGGGGNPLPTELVTANSTENIVPSATANTEGTPLLITPTVGRARIHMDTGTFSSGGVGGSETLTIDIEVDYTDGTMDKETNCILFVNANREFAANFSDLASANFCDFVDDHNPNGLSLTEMKFWAHSSIDNSTASVSLNWSGFSY